MLAMKVTRMFWWGLYLQCQVPFPPHRRSTLEESLSKLWALEPLTSLNCKQPEPVDGILLQHEWKQKQGSNQHDFLTCGSTYSPNINSHVKPTSTFQHPPNYNWLVRKEFKETQHYQILHIENTTSMRSCTHFQQPSHFWDSSESHRQAQLPHSLIVFAHMETLNIMTAWLTSLNIRWSSSLASTIRSLSLLSTTKIKPCVFWK